MKFIVALAVYLLMGIVLVWGIALLVARGNPWLLAVGFVAYSAMLLLIGCLPKRAH